MLAFKACWSASGGYGQSLSFVDDHIFIVVVDRDSTALNACVYLHSVDGLWTHAYPAFATIVLLGV